MGSAAVFPHGDTKGSLLHEGSAVLDSAKYVIRTGKLMYFPCSRSVLTQHSACRSAV